MPTPTPHATRPPRPDTLDKSVLVLTLCVWMGHFVLQSTLYHLTPDHSSDLLTLAARAVASIVGALVCLAMYALLRRRREIRPWLLLLKALALSVPACALITLVGEYSFLVISPYYRLNPDRWMHPSELVPGYLGYLWMLFTWCALYVGATAILEMHRRDAQLAAAHSAAQQAQLHALRLQINPHFLFNTLNTLAGFIVLGRTQQSEKIVLNLARFLRHTLAGAPSQFVALADEIDTLRMYLDIETARFRDRLQIRYEVEPDCAEGLVPSLILLPLAENSVKHGLGDSEQGIEIAVGARREGDNLLLWLEDNGGPPDSAAKGLGIGLSNVAQQLAALFGDGAQLQAGPTPRGWRNLVCLPWRVGRDG